MPEISGALRPWRSNHAARSRTPQPPHAGTRPGLSAVGSGLKAETGPTCLAMALGRCAVRGGGGSSEDGIHRLA